MGSVTMSNRRPSQTRAWVKPGSPEDLFVLGPQIGSRGVNYTGTREDTVRVNCFNGAEDVSVLQESGLRRVRGVNERLPCS